MKIKKIVEVAKKKNSGQKDKKTVSKKKKPDKVLEALSESEDRYRDLVENSQDLICTHDLEGKILSMNKTAVRLTGYPLKDLLGMNLADLLIPDVRHLFKAYMAEIQSKGWSRGTMRVQTASGEPRYWEYYNTLRTKGVTVPIVRALGHDITERERAEKIQRVQYNIANALVKAETLASLLETVRKELSALIDTTNFLVAIYDETSGLLSAPFERDEKDAVPQWRAEKSLTGLVIRQKRSMVLSKEQIWQMSQAGTIELIGSRAETWLGVPLLIDEKVLGAIVVQSYDKADAYDQNGVSLLEIIASQLSAYIERKQAESQREAALAALQTAFQENRNLLGELQHRAKNSFAMIIGMINLALNAGVSPEIKAAFENLGLRVRSISELYSLLYSTSSFTQVRLDEYCARIAAPLVGMSGNVTLNTEMESITVPVKEAAPIGLILTELLTNVCKYAFPGGRRGTIAIALKKSAAGVSLEVRDDGIGLPAGFDFSGSAGMGLNLVRALAGQINGSFRMENNAAGTRCIVEFAAANNGSQ
jgi:PAS domain S-box-containing protein